MSKKVNDDEYIEETAEEVEEASEEYVDEKSARRIARRKRRIRNQILAYVALILIIAAVIVGGLYGVKRVFNIGGSSETASAGDTESTGEGEYDGSLIVITPPEIVLNIPEEVVPEQPVSEVDPGLLSLAQNFISQMSLEEKVAGLFFVTPESMMEGVDQAVVAGGKTEKAMNDYAVGGIIYTSKNIQSEKQITEMLQKTAALSKFPLFTGVEEEGGSVARISASIKEAPKMTDASELGLTGDTTGTYNSYTDIANYMTKLGFNVDFAPNGIVSDSKRSFASDGETAGSFVYQGVSAIQDHNVSSAVLDFPGIGMAEGDVSSGRATVEAAEDMLLTSDIVPYRMAVSAESDFITVTQASYPNIVGDYTPAFMSAEIVNRMLRTDLGYTGIIITAPMDVAAVTSYYTSAEASVAALNAGCDMLLRPENFKEAYQGVIDAVNNGTLSEERINDALTHIYLIKCKSALNAEGNGDAAVELP